MQEQPPQEQAPSLFLHCSELCALGWFPECLQLLDQAIALDGNNARYYSYRGDVWLELAEYTKALEDYQHAVALNPEDLYSRINLGWTYEKLRQFPQALVAYDALIERSPDQAIAHYNRGCALDSLKRLPEALSAYSQAIHLWSDFSGAYLNRGHVLSCMGRHQEALDDYNQAYLYGSTDLEIAWTIAWLHFGRNPLEAEERERLRHIADLYPAEHHYVSFVCLAVIAFHHRDGATALAHLQRAAQMEPDQWDMPFWQGMVLAWSGELDTASREIERVLQMGLPPLFLTPLYWLEKERPLFFQQYAFPLLLRCGMAS